MTAPAVVQICQRAGGCVDDCTLPGVCRGARHYLRLSDRPDERIVAVIATWRTEAGNLRAWVSDGQARAVERCAFQLEEAASETPNGAALP